MKYTIFKFETLTNKFTSFEELVSSEYFSEFGFDHDITQVDDLDAIKNFSCVFRKHNNKIKSIGRVCILLQTPKHLKSLNLHLLNKKSPSGLFLMLR